MKIILFLLSWILFTLIALGVIIFVMIEVYNTKEVDGVGIFISIFSLILSLTFVLKWKTEIWEREKKTLEECKDGNTGKNSEHSGTRVE